MVRLLLVFGLIKDGKMKGFNPTMVRLLRAYVNVMQTG